MKHASRSIPECSASVRIATEPGQDPGDDLEHDQERVGGDRDGRRTAAGAVVMVLRRRQRVSHASSSRAAWPRWEIASFSASVSSAIVRPGVSSATNSGS